jgi:hypothetical protein
MGREINALWVVQQMREAWPYAPAHRFLLFDRDSKFGADVVFGCQGHGKPASCNCAYPALCAWKD